MNGTCVHRFASWFAYHLSNFQFRWNWEDWSVALKNDPLHPKQKFIGETLQRCLRLSYHAKVVELVPESFKSLLPALAKPANKYEVNEPPVSNDGDVEMKDSHQETEDQVPGKEYAVALTEALKAKCTAVEALEILQEISNVSLNSDDGENSDVRVLIVNFL